MIGRIRVMPSVDLDVGYPARRPTVIKIQLRDGRRLVQSLGQWLSRLRKWFFHSINIPILTYWRNYFASLSRMRGFLHDVIRAKWKPA